MSTLTRTDLKSPRSLITLAVFLVLLLGIGGLIGTSTAPGVWYAELNKPFFTPPNWLFGPVWTALYVLIAIAGWRTFMLDPRGTGMKLWAGQMILNWAWSPIWFGLHQTWLALAVIIGILALIVVFIVDRWNKDRPSAWLFVPYAAWVGYATILNLTIALLN